MEVKIQLEFGIEFTSPSLGKDLDYILSMSWDFWGG
jgi:hypothetical protein